MSHRFTIQVEIDGHSVEIPTLVPGNEALARRVREAERSGGAPPRPSEDEIRRAIDAYRLGGATPASPPSPRRTPQGRDAPAGRRGGLAAGVTQEIRPTNPFLDEVVTGLLPRRRPQGPGVTREGAVPPVESLSTLEAGPIDLADPPRVPVPFGDDEPIPGRAGNLTPIGTRPRSPVAAPVHQAGLAALARSLLRQGLG